MLSILKYNSLRSELYTPMKGTIENNVREGKGVQFFPNGMSIRGNWKENKIQGEAILKFSDNKTEVRGLVSDEGLISGIIRYDTGVRVEGDFHSNGAHEIFKNVVITFKSRYYFKAEYSLDGKLEKGVLFKSNCLLVGTYNGSKMVVFTDDAKTHGIIIDESIFYEGGIEHNEPAGDGVEYFPLGLVYYKYERTGKELDGSITSMCIAGHSQFTCISRFMERKIVYTNKLHVNGVREQFDISYDDSSKFMISFEKSLIKGNIRSPTKEFKFPNTSKGVFQYGNLELPVNFSQSRMKFTLIYEGQEYTLDGFFEFINGKTSPETNIQGPISPSSNFLEVQEAMKQKKPGLADAETLNNQLLELKNKSKNLLVENKGHQETIIDLQGQLSYLRKMLSLKDEIIKDLETKIESNNFLYEIKDLTYFKGTLVNYVKTGHCEEITNGEYFCGTYDKGKREGDGLLQTENWDYRGSFISGKLNGKGSKVFSNSSKILEGEFFDNFFMSKEMKFKSCTYIGDIERDMMNGEGTLEFKNGFNFTGKFVNDEIFEGDYTGVLTDGVFKKQYSVTYKYVADLKMKVFESKSGEVFSVNLEEGVVQRIK